VKIEIEAKLKVSSLEEIASRLKQLGARFLCRSVQKDTYFDDDQQTLLNSDKGLRLRRERNEAGEKIILTYKGPREEKLFKSRKEIELELDSFENMTELLAALGYQRKLVFEKKRDLWHLNDCQVCLDELPLLGCFVEIEALSEQKITETIEKLNLTKFSHIKRSYAIMIREKLNEINPEKTEAMFEHLG